MTVVREVRVYSHEVSDPMLRFPAAPSSAPFSPLSPPPSFLPVSPALGTGSSEVYWRVETGTLEHSTLTGDQCSGGMEVWLDSDGNISDCQVGDGNILDMEDGLTYWLTGRLDGDGVESRPLLVHGDIADPC